MSDVLSASLVSYKLLADNTLRATIDIEPAEVDAFLTLFRERGTPLAVARLNLPQARPTYGQQAKALRLSGFFRTPQVWAAIGSDQEYAAWCRRQKCAICARQDWLSETGEYRCEYAHVRREAGVGMKPEYSGLPLCHACHARQHQQGEEAALHAHKPGEPDARRWFEKQVVEHLVTWGWETLRQQLGYPHWSDTPPGVLKDWAQQRDLLAYLPEDYRESD